MEPFWQSGPRSDPVLFDTVPTMLRMTVYIHAVLCECILIKEYLFYLKWHNITRTSNYLTLIIHMNRCVKNGAFLAIKTYKTVCNAIYKQFAATLNRQSFKHLIFGNCISNIACQFKSFFSLPDFSDIIIDWTRWSCARHQFLWPSFLLHYHTHNAGDNCSCYWWNQPGYEQCCHNWMGARKCTIQ